MTRSRVLRALLTLALLLALGAAGGAWWFYDSFLSDLPDLRRIEDYEPSRSSIVYDRHGREIGEFYEERRRLVPIEEIPKHVQLAFVAAEDGSFFEHEGLDYRGILRAALANLLSGEKGQGASTITQQMVKSLLLTPEKTYRRKIREMFLARDIEKRFTKEEILYLYLNQIYFGQGAWGVEEAARTYFGKSVREISVSEAALLAGLPQRPSDYSPYRNPEAAESRRRYVLGRMFADGIIDRDTYAAALADRPELGHAPETEHYEAAAHFTELVRRYLYERLGGDRVLEGGLVIETTLDLDLQLAAVEAVRRGLEEHDHRAGYRGVLRTAKAGEIDAAVAEAAEENADAYVRLLPEDLGLEPPPAEGAATPPVGAGTAAANDASAAAPSELVVDAERETIEVAEADAAVEADDEEGLEGIEMPPLRLPEPLPIALDVPYGEPMRGVVIEVDRKAELARVALGEGLFGTLALADVDWARKPNPTRRPIRVSRIDWIVKVGDVAEFVRLPDLTPAQIEDGRAAPETRPIYDPLLDADTLARLEAEGALPEPIAELQVARLDLHQVPRVQGALLSMEVGTGDVIALVGGYDYESSEFNRAVQAKRQPGSAFKPFIYGAALAKDYTPVSEVVDRPVVYTDPVSGFTWAPRNYGRRFYGPMPLRNALKKSVNNATVHLFREVGVDYVIDYARRLGIQSPLSRDLSLALGSSSVTLLELTTAYAVFPNHGKRVLPRFITKVTASDGTVLLEDVPLGPPPPPVLRPLDAGLGDDAGDDAVRTTAIDDLDVYPDAEIMPTDQIIPEAQAYLMCDLLRAVVEEGTGRRLKRLGRPLAGKTGTTNEQGDAWFMGFSPEIVTGVWVGHDDNTVLGWGETGAGAALPIWGDFMKVALTGVPIRDFDVPDENIVFERIDRDTGLIADASTQNAYYQPFIAGTQPDHTVTESRTASDAEEALREDLF